MDNVDASHALVIVNNQDLTADINLNVSTGGATSNLSIPANATISGTNTGDQTITLDRSSHRNRHRILRHDSRGEPDRH